MADDPLAGLPGLQDGLGSENLADTAHKTDEVLSRLNTSVQQAEDAYRENSISLYEYQRVLRDSIDAIRDHARNSRDEGAQIREMIGLYERAGRSLVDAQKRNKDWSDAVATSTSVINTMGSVLASATGPELIKNVTGGAQAFGQTLMKLSNNEVGMLGTAAKAAGAGLSIMSVAATTLVAVIDSAADAQKSATDVFLQSGVRAKEQSDAIRIGTDSIVRAGTKYNLSEKEAGNLALSLARAGVLIDKNSGSIVAADAATATYTRQVDTLSAAHKAYGSDLGVLATVGTQLGTRFSRTGEDFDEAFGRIIKSGRASGAQMDYFLKNFSDLSTQTRAVGTSFEQVLFGASHYTDELRKGTLSLQDVISLTDAQSLSMDKQAGIYAMVNQLLPDVAKQLKFTGDAAHDIFRAAEVRRTGSAEDKAAMSDLPRLLAAAQARQTGGGREEQLLIFHQLLGEFGTNIKNLDATFDLFNGSVVKHTATTDEQKALSLSAKETTDRMKSDAIDTAKRYDGASKQFSDSVREFHSTVMSLTDAIIRGEATGKVGMAIRGITGEGGEGYISQEQARTRARVSSRSRATGGLIPEEGNYYLHAGERVTRSGQGGGGMAISLGGIQVHVGDQGDVRGQVSAAMDKLKTDVLQQVEDQWNAANLSQ